MRTEYAAIPGNREQLASLEKLLMQSAQVPRKKLCRSRHKEASFRMTLFDKMTGYPDSDVFTFEG